MRSFKIGDKVTYIGNNSEIKTWGELTIFAVYSLSSDISYYDNYTNRYRLYFISNSDIILSKQYLFEKFYNDNT